MSCIKLLSADNTEPQSVRRTRGGVDDHLAGSPWTLPYEGRETRLDHASGELLHLIFKLGHYPWLATLPLGGFQRIFIA